MKTLIERKIIEAIVKTTGSNAEMCDIRYDLTEYGFSACVKAYAISQDIELYNLGLIVLDEHGMVDGDEDHPALGTLAYNYAYAYDTHLECVEQQARTRKCLKELAII